MNRLSALIRRRRAGFTLIELLIVIVIIGILIAIGVPAYLKYTAAANDRDAQAALTTAYKAALAGDTEVNSGRFPVASTVVNDVKADEPAASVARGDCAGAVVQAPVKQVLVDPSSTTTQVTMCVRSASGTIWKLTGPLTGMPTVADGSTVTLAMAGAEITDAVRAAATSGDGLTNDSSTGVWEPTTNLAKNGGFETATTFTGTYGSSGTPSVDATHVLFGAKALKFTADGVSANAGIYATDTGSGIPNNRLPATAGSTYTSSAFIWTSAPLTFRPEIEWYQADGATRSAITNTSYSSVQTTTAGQWTRVSVTGVAPSDAVGMTPTLYLTGGPSSAAWWYDGFQVEAKGVPTPYVETNGATASRAGGQVLAPVSLLSPAQGWIATRIRPSFGSTTGDPGYNVYVFSWGRSSVPGDDWIALRRVAGGGGNWNAVMQVGGSTVVNGNVNVSWTPGQPLTLIEAWDANTVKLSVNGAAFTSFTKTTPGAVPAPVETTFEIGGYVSSYGWMDSDVFWFACGTGTLSSGDAATINGWGANDPKRSSFPTAAQATMAWDGVSSSASLR